MAKSGFEKESTNIRRLLNRSFRRATKQRLISSPFWSTEGEDRRGSVASMDLPVFKKTSGWLTW